MPSRTYQEIEIPFTLGKVVNIEDTLLPEGAVENVENWVPEQTGGVRVRQGWSRSSLTGGPATSKGLSAHTYGKSNTGAIRQRVSSVVSNTSFSTITLSWTIPTLTGSTLVVKLAEEAGANIIGWFPNPWQTSLQNYHMVANCQGTSTSPGTDRGILLVKENAPSESSITFTLNVAAIRSYIIEAIEYTSVVTSTPKNILPGWASNCEEVYNQAGVKAIGGWERDDNVDLNGRVSGGPGSAQTGRFWLDTIIGPGGTSAIRLPIGTNGVPITGSTQYTFSGYYSVSGLELLLRPDIDWYDSGGAFISASTGAETTLSVINTWQRISITATSPANAAFAVPKGRWRNTNGAASRTGAWDSMQLELGAVATAWEQGSLTCMEQLTIGTDTTPATTTVTPTGNTTHTYFWGDATIFNWRDVGADIAASGWTNSYVEQLDQNTTSLVCYMASASRQFTSAGGFATEATIASLGGGYANADWVIYALKLNPAALSDSSLGFYIATNIPDATTLEFWRIDPDDVVSGSWTQIDSDFAVTHAGIPVASALGLGVIMFAQPKLSTLKYWSGAGNLVNIASTYPGRGLAFFKSRFFNGGADNYPTRLSYSDIGTPSVWGVSNFIEVGQDDGYTIEAIEVWETYLVIGKGNSIYTLTGSGPDTFTLYPLSAGNAAPGNSIVSTPYGAIIAGTTDVWQLFGNAAEPISKNLGASYAPTGYVHTAYVNDRVYILDVSGGQIFVYDFRSQTWYVEKYTSANNQPVYLTDDRSKRLMMDPLSSTDTGLIIFRDEPAAAYVRDFSPLTQTHRLESGTIWPTGPAIKMTPTRLFLQLRQRGTGTGDLTINMNYHNDDAVTAGTAVTVSPRATAGTYRVRKDLGRVAGCSAIDFTITGPTSGVQWDIESMILGYEEEVTR